MKSILTITFIVVATIFFSCSKKQDNNVPPAIGAISMTGVHEADTLKGTLATQVVVSGSTQPTKIEVYANDTLITTVSKAPYNLQWNTLGVNNGNYKLKAIAYDNVGKQTQATLDVVVHNILVTLLVDPKINSLYGNIMYIVTDSAGSVLNSIKYNGTDNYIAVAATHPDIKSRCSVFEVKTDINAQTYVTAYMSIPKGSSWNLRGITPHINPSFAATNLSFTNIPAFTRMTISSDAFGITYTSPSTIPYITNYGLTPTGKQLVQYVDNNNNGYYAFFNVDTTKQSTSFNLGDSTFHPSIKKTITINGATSGNSYLYGRSDLNYESYYAIDINSFQGSTFSYFYPDGGYLTDYKSSIYYIQNGWTYINVYAGLLPQNITPFGTTSNITSNSLSSFTFSSQGGLDYYSVNFWDAIDKANITVFNTAAHPAFQFPDILKLTNLSNAPISNFKIHSFTMYKTPGFDETKLFYYSPNDFPSLSLPSQSATQYFN
ncbi:MAG TPA: Ig-like domain-containing protein [Mucilaginibacter sp.]|nr:Ig-like domain-containing protein [Mucilaginibacter sp.]